MLTLKDVSYSYGSYQVLNSLDFDVSPGDRVFISGNNGVGKSTMLKIAAGLMAPQSGTVCRESTVSYQGHEPQLYLDLSVKENLEFFSCLNLLKDSKINALANKKVNQLSKGQVQWIALAMTLRGSDFLLLDEPSSHLDKQVVADLQAKLAERSLVLVSHQDDAFRDLCNKFYILEHGQLQQTS